VLHQAVNISMVYQFYLRLLHLRTENKLKATLQILKTQPFSR